LTGAARRLTPRPPTAEVAAGSPMRRAAWFRPRLVVEVVGDAAPAAITQTWAFEEVETTIECEDSESHERIHGDRLGCSDVRVSP
jgi:hypothetical protein